MKTSEVRWMLSQMNDEEKARLVLRLIRRCEELEAIAFPAELWKEKDDARTSALTAGERNR